LAIVERLLDDLTVDVKWMYAPSEFGKYTLWRGAAKEGNIGVSSIIAVIQKLTHTRHGRIKHHDKNKITAGLADPTFSLFSIKDDTTPEEDPIDYGLASSSSSSSEEEEKKVGADRNVRGRRGRGRGGGRGRGRGRGSSSSGRGTVRGIGRVRGTGRGRGRGN
jgi:hypothetical protein